MREQWANLTTIIMKLKKVNLYEVKNTKFISGTFDIHSWQRPVDFTFEILNDKKPIKIKLK